MQGKIMKGIAGFYYVNVETKGLYECKAKGIFRNKNIKPLVGDDVVIDVIDDDMKTGNIIDILKRKSELIRPAVANVDQAIIIFAAADPTPNFNLLDRFLVMMRQQHMKTIICFNKIDKISEEEKENLIKIYKNSDCNLQFTCVKTNEGIEAIKGLLLKKTTVLAGPSGVGKSSLINIINPEAEMETGAISEKIKRGKHTTRHSELIFLGNETYIMDTPGFSSLALFDMEKEELKDWYPEFEVYENQCRFNGCSHMNEPNCMVKERLESGEISEVRYANYKLLYEELKQQKKY